MEKFRENKFTVGDLVHDKRDKGKVAYEIVGFSYNGAEWFYRVNSKEWDFERKEVINGISYFRENELEKANVK